LRPVNAQSVLALCEKYREIKRLRSEHAAGLRGDPRRELIALARRFPGSLRELDQLPMEVIETRLEALETMLTGRAAVAEWVRLQIDYHAWMRTALRIKQMAAAASGDRVAAVLAQLPRRYAPAVDEPPLSSLDPETVAAILKPLGGRLNPWVYARVAALHGVDPERVRSALFLR
jgi:hypothetical protein